MAPLQPSLDIIIVNWNAGALLRNCLESIAASNLDGIDLQRVVVVDNASSDNSTQGLDDIKIPLTLLANPENRGFAAACNQGVQESTADYLLFLNPDIRLYENSLKIPVECVNRPENQKIGVVGIQLVDEQGHIARSCARFPTPRSFFGQMLGLDRLLPGRFLAHPMTEWDHRDSRDVDHVIGAFYLVRRSIFEQMNGFDTRYFVYLEDLDLSLRIRQAGWRIAYLTEAQAYHKGCGTSDQIRARRLFYSLRSKILYGYKHFNPITATALALGTFFIEPVPRIALGLAKGSLATVGETIRAYGLLWKALLNLFKNAV
ncbi:MAG: glycosyltransferase family 2 protein [Phycisphaerae bacterium]